MPLVTTDRVAFREALPQGGRLVGMDVGTKTIGLALCDARWSIASPAHTITRSKFSKDKLLLAAFITQQQVKGIVIGLPLNLDGTGSPPVLLWDERWSTQAVTRTLIEADASRARRDVLVDKLAASYILQGAIDGLVAGLE